MRLLCPTLIIISLITLASCTQPAGTPAAFFSGGPLYTSYLETENPPEVAALYVYVLPQSLVLPSRKKAVEDTFACMRARLTSGGTLANGKRALVLLPAGNDDLSRSLALKAIPSTAYSDAAIYVIAANKPLTRPDDPHNPVWKSDINSFDPNDIQKWLYRMALSVEQGRLGQFSVWDLMVDSRLADIGRVFRVLVLAPEAQAQVVPCQP